VADKDISSVLGPEFPSEVYQCLFKIQTAVLAASGPIIGLLSDFVHQGFSGKGEDELMPIELAM
jgi:hypothetical protein